jgi:hypothetical protein
MRPPEERGQITGSKTDHGHGPVDAMRACRVKRDVAVAAYITELIIIQLQNLKQLCASDESDVEIDRVLARLDHLFGVMSLITTTSQVRLPTLCVHPDDGWSVVTAIDDKSR